MKTSPDDSLAGRTKQLHGVTFTSPVILFLFKRAAELHVVEETRFKHHDHHNSRINHSQNKNDSL